MEDDVPDVYTLDEDHAKELKARSEDADYIAFELSLDKWMCLLTGKQ